MSPGVVAVILAAYLSVLFELTVLHVPSVASSLRIWSPRDAWVATHSDRYRRLFDLPKAKKLALFFLPLAIVYAVYAYPLVVAWVGPDPLGDYAFGPSAATDVAAVALILAGRAISLTSALTIRRLNAQAGGSFHLHTSGPFRWSRNPGLIGMYLFALGLWLIAPSARMLAGIVVYATYMHFKVRIEEDFLAHKFGAQYADYRLRTGRYLP